MRQDWLHLFLVRRLMDGLDRNTEELVTFFVDLSVQFVFTFLGICMCNRGKMFVQPCMFLQLWVGTSVHAPCILGHCTEYYTLCASIFAFIHLFLFRMEVCLCVLEGGASIQVPQSGSISSGRPLPQGKAAYCGHEP